MASEKKPSIYSDRSNFGSVEELDEYGVWVKSEPQVLSSELDIEETASVTENINLPDDEFGSMPGDDSFAQDESLNVELSVFEDNISGIELPELEEPGNALAEPDDFAAEDFSVEDNTAPTEPDDFAAEDFSVEDNFDVPTVESIENDFDVPVKKEGELSTQLLLQIAGELSSIRNELSELKKEFAIARSAAPEAASDEEKSAEDHEHGGFFAEEDDETIALTGDELDNILNTADFTEESGANESPEAAMEESFAETPEDSALDDSALGDSALEDSTLDDSALGGTLDDSVLDDSTLDGTLDDNALDDSALGDSVLDDSTLGGALDDNALGDGVFGGDDIGGDFGLDDDLDTEESAGDIEFPQEVTLSEEMAFPEESEVSEEIELPGEMALSDESVLSEGDEPGELADISFDSMDFDSDIETEETPKEEPLLEEEVSEEITSTEEIPADDALTDDFADDSLTFDIDSGMEDISLSDDLLMDTGTDEEPAETPVTEAEEEISLDEIDLDNEEISLVDETNDSIELKKLRQEGAVPLTFPPENSSYLEEDAALDSDSFDLSDAVIDEPDLSAENITDSVNEPSLEDFSFLDMSIAEPAEEITATDDTESLDEILTDDSEDMGLPADIPEAFLPLEDIEAPSYAADDSLEQVIPEGFEAEIEETPVPFDDDLESDLQISEEGFEEEALETEPAAEPVVVSPSAGTGEGAVGGALGGAAAGKNGIEIPSALKAELRTVLSYMDQLLESLPEEKIEEFAKSEYFDSYKRLFKELGLV